MHALPSVFLSVFLFGFSCVRFLACFAPGVCLLGKKQTPKQKQVVYLVVNDLFSNIGCGGRI